MAKSYSYQYTRNIDTVYITYNDWDVDTKIFFLHPDDIGCETTICMVNNENGKTYFNGHLVLAKHRDAIFIRSLSRILLNGYFDGYDEQRPQRNHEASKALGALQASVFAPANRNRIACIVD